MNVPEGLELALATWANGRRAGLDHGAACARATREVLEAGLTRWQALAVGGALARARPVRVEEATAVGPTLQRVSVSSRTACWGVDAGEELPIWDGSGRRRRGAFDTPRDLAREVVEAALQASSRGSASGLDPACGTGAFLLALDEAGVGEIIGVDSDPVALAVARQLVPRARLVQADSFTAELPCADVVVGNPPFVPPERQDKALRRQLVARFPWLVGRFDLAVPFAELAVQSTLPGGGLGLVVPASLLVQPYGLTWRRRWIETHGLRHLRGPLAFPGASVQVALLALTEGAGPSNVPGGLSAQAVMSLPASPFDPKVQPSDLALVQAIRTASLPLGSLAKVDTGLVVHGPMGGKDRLLRDKEEPGTVPYVDARDLFRGKTRWLHYRPNEMHRPKSPALFAPAKLLVQRLRGGGPVKGRVDREGRFAGHTLLVAVPREDCPIDPERLLSVVCSPVAQAVTRVERGPRLDLYPEDLRSLPVPLRWLQNQDLPLHEAWGLGPAQADQLVRLAAF